MNTLDGRLEEEFTINHSTAEFATLHNSDHFSTWFTNIARVTYIETMSSNDTEYTVVWLLTRIVSIHTVCNQSINQWYDLHSYLDLSSVNKAKHTAHECWLHSSLIFELININEANFDDDDCESLLWCFHHILPLCQKTSCQRQEMQEDEEDFFCLRSCCRKVCFKCCITTLSSQ